MLILHVNMLDCHSRHLCALTVSTVNCSLLAEQDKKCAPSLALKEETISFISTHISLYTCERHSRSAFISARPHLTFQLYIQVSVTLFLCHLSPVHLTFQYSRLPDYPTLSLLNSSFKYFPALLHSSTESTCVSFLPDGSLQ